MKELEGGDLVSGLLQLDEKIGKLELDEGGYERFIPSEEENKSLSSWLVEEAERAISDHKSYFAKVYERISAYEAVPTPMPGGGTPALTLPIAKRDANQIRAWLKTVALRPRPLFSVDPYLPATYPSLADVTEMGPVEMELNAEDIAAAWELALDYKFRERIPFRRIFDVVVTDCVIGASPSWVKVCYEKTNRQVRVPKRQKTPEGWVEVVGKEERTIQDGEPVKILNVPVFNVLLPMGYEDPQAAPLLFERTPMSKDDLRSKLSSGEYNLVPEDKWTMLLDSGMDDLVLDGTQQVRALDRRSTSKGVRLHNIVEVWFTYKVKVKKDNEMGESSTRFETMELCGHVDLGSKLLLDLYRNPYDHGQRPYVPFFQDQKPHRFAGASTVDDVMNHQTRLAQLLHLNLQNAVQANLFMRWALPDTEAMRVLATQEQLAGSIIPGEQGKDWGIQQTGSNYRDMNGDIGFLNEDASMTTGVSGPFAGRNIPNRTPAATVSQVMESGQMQPLQSLASYSDQFSKVVKFYLRTLKQYLPFGEIIPTRDPDTKKLLEIAMRFPVEDVFDNFRIALTAADEELAKEADFEQLTMQFNIIGQYGQALAQIMGPAADPNMPPAMSNLLVQLATGTQEMVKVMFERTRRDPERFIGTRKMITDVMDEKMAAQQAMMQQQQMMGGGDGGNQEVGPEGSGPGVGGGPVPGGPGGAVPQPALPGPGGGGPPQGA